MNFRTYNRWDWLFFVWGWTGIVVGVLLLIGRSPGSPFLEIGGAGMGVALAHFYPMRKR